MVKLVSFVGFADAGKSTAAKILVENCNFVSMSFADSIKDCVASIFCWRRDLLEGITSESRIFRETVDTWWANKLNIPNFTPRFAMQNFATENMRHHFHDNIWVFNVEKRLLDAGNSVVFGDVRHPNEIALTKRMNGTLIRIKKGNDPEWFEIARQANSGDEKAKIIMNDVFGIHDSEMAWIGCEMDHCIENNGSIQDLRENLMKINF